MSEIIVTPDVDTWAYDYLDDALDGRSESYADATVAIRAPEPTEKVNRYVWVRRDGGPRISRVLDVPLLAVNVICESEKDCADLSALVAGLLLAAADGDPVTSVRQILGPSPVDDPTGLPRRYMTFELTVRGTTA